MKQLQNTIAILGFTFHWILTLNICVLDAPVPTANALSLHDGILIDRYRDCTYWLAYHPRMDLNFMIVLSTRAPLKTTWAGCNRRVLAKADYHGIPCTECLLATALSTRQGAPCSSSRPCAALPLHSFFANCTYLIEVKISFGNVSVILRWKGNGSRSSIIQAEIPSPFPTSSHSPPTQP